MSLPYRAAAPFSGRAKLGREEIKWQELLAHFRSVQVRHEKSRRQALGMENSIADGLLEDSTQGGPSASGSQADKVYMNGTPGSGVRPPARRRVTGESHAPPASAPSVMGRTLSPLNPRSRGNGLFGSGPSTALARPRSPSVLTTKQRRTLGIGPKG